MRLASHTLFAAVLFGLAACGGGSDPAPSAPSQPVAGSQTGVLTDSPVEGVAYETSGGFSGLTSADGHYRYNPGETVTFTIGGITLGTVPATGTVTPIELAGSGAGAPDRATNLLVLLQSLDADGDPGTRITINQSTRTAAANASLDFSVAPATFADVANADLVALITASGNNRGTPVAPHEALAHFKQQFLQDLRGGWMAEEGGSVVVLRFEQDGSYAMGEAGPSGGGGHTGIELGLLGWDATTAGVSASVAFDNNGEWGLSSAQSGDTLRIDGQALVYGEPDGATFRFSRVPNDPDGIVGMWSLDLAADTGKQVFVFLPDNRFFMIDPVGDEDGNCAVAKGVEFGTYSYSAATGVLTVTQQPAVDQNGCAGLWDAAAGSGGSLAIAFNTDKTLFTVEGRTVHRISR